MPLTDKGDKIMSNMKSEYGDKKGTSVFYASKNAGKIAGVDKDDPPPPPNQQADLIVSPPRAPTQENDSRGPSKSMRYGHLDTDDPDEEEEYEEASDRFDDAVAKIAAIGKRLDEAGKQQVTHEPGAPGEKGKGITTQDCG